MESNVIGSLAEALTADQQVVLADDSMTVHADSASAASSAVFLRVSVPQVVSHSSTIKVTERTRHKKMRESNMLLDSLGDIH